MADDYTLKDRIKDLGDSISEQFRNIARQLEIIDEKLDGKASLVQLAQLEERLTKVLDRHTSEIGELRATSSGTSAATKTQLAVYGIVIAGIFGLIGTLIFVVVSTGGHA